MHILFVHQNFPAQFGHIAHYLVENHGFQCTFVSQRPEGNVGGIRKIQYQTKGGATAKTHYCARSFENAVAHTHGVFEACEKNRDLQPDLIVGHSGFGSTLFLRELYDCPIINYFEYFYRAHGSDLDFRPEFPSGPLDTLRSYCRNATLLLDLENCTHGYSPTHWQKNLIPQSYTDKVDVIFDGVDTEIWQPWESVPRMVGPRKIDPDTRIITYVSRGMESMRGFDIFMKVAKRIYESNPNVIFAVVGAERTAYGGDLKHIKEDSFKEYVFNQDNYNLEKFCFLGNVQPRSLARLLSISDLHIYLTVPFVLSWSLFDALACGCTVVASNTDPVRELVTHEQNGLLADFYDIDGLTDLSLGVLDNPEDHAHLGKAGCDLIQKKYSLEQMLPKMLDLYERVTSMES